MKFIAFANHKGGCCKTTSCSNVAAALGKMGKKVLIIDLDSQGSLSSAYGIEDENINNTIYTLAKLRGISTDHVRATIKHTPFSSIDIIPADVTLTDLDGFIYGSPDKYLVLKNIFKYIPNEYDYVFLDCPQGLSVVTLNALICSDYLIVPVLPTYFTMKGTKFLMDTIKSIKKANPKLSILGFLITIFDRRVKDNIENKDILYDIFKDKVFNTVIRTDASIVNSQNIGIPIVYLNEKARASMDYMEVAKEVIERDK